MKFNKYKEQNGLDTQEKLLKHIDELKRNTVVNQELVNFLVDDFFAGEKSGTNATRHKSRSGETHTVFSTPAGLKDVNKTVVIELENPLEFPQLNEIPKVRANFYKYVDGQPIIEVKEFSSLPKAREYFSNSDWSEGFYYNYGTKYLIGQDYKEENPLEFKMLKDFYKTTQEQQTQDKDDRILKSFEELNKEVKAKKEKPLKFPELKSNSWSDLVQENNRIIFKNPEEVKTNLKQENFARLFNIIEPNKVNYYDALYKAVSDEFLEALSDEVIKNSSRGVKTNESKPQMSLLFKQFPQALEAIVKCSEYGNTKYKETDSDFLNFQRVEGGSKTYADAGLRHRLEQGNDSESGLPHQYHVAWNALAELQIWIMENKR